jgi:hypothetical protein
MKKRKTRMIIDDDPDINIAVSREDAPATATTDGEIAAPTSIARATEPLTASKRIKNCPTPTKGKQSALNRPTFSK